MLPTVGVESGTFATCVQFLGALHSLQPRLRRARLADEGLAEEDARAAALAAPAMTLDVVANLLNGIEEVFQAAAGPEAQQKYLDDVMRSRERTPPEGEMDGS